MALDSYTGLKASIADFLNRSDLTSTIPDFITMAEAQLNSRLMAMGPVRQMLGTWPTTISAELTSLPNDFLGVKSVYLTPMSTSPRVQFAEPEKIDEQKLIRPSQDGDPQLFSISGPSLQLWPYNGGTYTGSIRYWQSLPALSVSNTSNWLLAARPDIYLYTSLIQSAPYLKDDDRIQVWGTIAATGLSDLVTADKFARQAPQESAPILPFDPP